MTDLQRYIVTVETAKHRVFQFLRAGVLPDNKLVAIASDDAYSPGVLFQQASYRLGRCGRVDGSASAMTRFTSNPAASTRSHSLTQTTCKSTASAQIAERLDANRKRVLAEHEHLTLTGLYNVLEKLRAGTAPADLTSADRRIFDDGLVGILKEDHDKLDAAVAAAYGWPADLPEPKSSPASSP